MSAQKIRILIAEDHLLFAESLSLLLEREHGLEVAGKVATGKELLEKLNDYKPDLILLDLKMPVVDGFEAAQKIRKENGHIKILVVTTYVTTKIVHDLLDLGVNGVLYKDAHPNELLEAINRVTIENGIYIQKPISEKMEAMVPKDEFLVKYNLSKRELEIIQLLKEGKSTKQIAAELFLAEYTVDTHKKNIYRKLGVNNMASLLQFVVKSSL